MYKEQRQTYVWRVRSGNNIPGMNKLTEKKAGGEVGWSGSGAGSVVCRRQRLASDPSRKRCGGGGGGNTGVAR